MKLENELTGSTTAPTFLFIWYMLIFWLYPYLLGRYPEELMSEVPLIVIGPYAVFFLFLISLTFFMKQLIHFDYKNDYEHTIKAQELSAEEAEMFLYFTHLKRLVIFSIAVFILKSLPRKDSEVILFIYLNILLILPFVNIYVGKIISRHTGVLSKKNKLFGWLGVPTFIGSILALWASVSDWLATIKYIGYSLVSVIVSDAGQWSKPGDLWLIPIYSIIVIYGVLSAAAIKININSMIEDIKHILMKLKHIVLMRSSKS